MTALLVGFAAAFGAIIGSTVNAFVPRMVAGEGGYLTGRSYCPHCKTTLRARHLVPVLSYLAIGGRCASCRAKIPVRYLLVELFGATAFALITWHALRTGMDLPHAVVLFLLAGSLLALSLYDAMTMELPYALLLPAIGFAALYASLPGGLPLQSALVGAAVAGGFFLLQILILTPLYRARARRAGETPPEGVLGGGDALLGIALGLAVGWPAVVPTLFGAYLLGAAVSVPLLLLKRKEGGSQIPFGPFLAAATLLGILWGDMLVRSYLGLLAAQ